MQAHPGDELIIRGRRAGQPNRTGEVLEAKGPDDTQPFLVKWDDTGHTTLFFPGSDCVVHQLPRSAKPSGGDRRRRSV